MCTRLGPRPPPPPQQHTHIYSHGLLFCQSSHSGRFLPGADSHVRGDFFFFFASIFGRGSDKQHGGILKCQLKMKINNLGEGGVRDTVNITHILPRTDSARPRGQRGD